jgi:hypothetical protein
MKYFAYGSNMFTPRLRFRVPHCKALTTATLPKYALRFHKRSQDGSGKCNALFTAKLDDHIIGIVFEIPEAEKSNLDHAEALDHGYNETSVDLLLSDASLLPAQMYVADSNAIDDALIPYSWYKDFVLKGAEEHRLPGPYVDTYIRSIASKPDLRPGKDAQERAKVS